MESTKKNQAPVGNAKKTSSVSDAGYSSLYLLTLLVSGLFVGLLVCATGDSVSAGIDADSASIRIVPDMRYRTSFERDLDRMVEGHPISSMIPYISKRDPETAKYLVSIAKHESNWGLYSPKDETGATCYNYWGFRGSGDRVTNSGYTCFESPEQAVAVVGKRLDYLIWDLRLDTPAELIVWKCGRSCAGHDGSGVRNWIGNVDYYSRKIEDVRLAGAWQAHR